MRDESAEAKALRSALTIAFRVLFIWAFVWLWNPFHFGDQQRWWVGVVLWWVDSAHTGIYERLNK